MIRSMTGFASLTHEDARVTIGVTVRTVNHRHLDLQLRLPQAYAEMEPEVRSLVQRRLTRGRVELAVTVQMRDVTAPGVTLNTPLMAAIGAAIDEARERGWVTGDLTPGDLLRLPQAVIVDEGPREALAGDVAQVRALVTSAIEQAISSLDLMRVEEGAHLNADLVGRKQTLTGLIERLAAAADQGREALEERLQARVTELLAQAPVDQALVVQEVARAVQRSDVSEEVARFRGHLAHWDALSESEEACGRRLDFLLQEMNREINTFGAKADGLQVSELVIATKAELERMREQVQNVE